MKILFLDQTGKLGGAEFALIDIADLYKKKCLVGLFEDGPFRKLLEEKKIPVEIFKSKLIQVKRNSSFISNLGSIKSLIALIWAVARKASDFDVIFANTQKALIVGAIASWVSRRPLIYYLHDILSEDHFSISNIRISTTFANRFSSLIIADSQATKKAFIEAGGRPEITNVVYYGFKPELYIKTDFSREILRKELGFESNFIVGHFGRLGHWKGQHVLIEALTKCHKEVVAIFVGGAFFDVDSYVVQLHQLVTSYNLENRVKFLGFRTNIPQMMWACDLIAHTSVAPEPFGRVIVEGMLCERPVIASNAGGATEIINHGQTGWLHTPGDSEELALLIDQCRSQPQKSAAMAKAAREQASQQYNISTTNPQIEEILKRFLKN
jgi:glycosyltransferase involved in cell wall biosynthesis